MKIVVASNNKGKIDEIKSILSDYEVLSMAEAGIDLEIEENGKTFSENSKIKARAISKLTDEIVLADDSGLEIHALNDFPGVQTRRFLGEDATDEERNNYLLKQLEGKEGADRAAACVTNITVIIDGKEYTVVGVTDGSITKEPRGTHGFGFDPIFETTRGETFAEMFKSDKDMISSRRRALNKLKKMNIL